MRGLLAAAMLVLGSVSVGHSLAWVIGERDPAQAHALAPWDGRITGLLARERFSNAQVASADSPPARLARTALRQNAMAISAANVLGLQAQLRGDVNEAHRLLGYSQLLSRRDLQSQLWAIEDAVARGDVPRVLRHYDLALRTSKRAPELLFPILSSAIADTAVRANLVATLTGDPAWGPAFVTYVAETKGDPRVKASLFTALRRAGTVVSPEATAGVVDGLIAADLHEAAWRFYASVRDGASRNASRDPRFTAELAKPSAFDWIPVADGSIEASIQRTGSGGVFDFAAPPGAGGPLLRQLQMLPPGDYQIEGHSIGIEPDERSLPYWALTCRDGRELGRVFVPPSARAGGMFAGRFRVPAGCPVQTLTLVARGSDNMLGAAGQIDRLLLSPSRTRADAGPVTRIGSDVRPG